MLKATTIEQVVQRSPLSKKRPSIAKTHPHLSQQWCYEKNCGFTPEDFSFGSCIAVWWRCLNNANHIWQAPIHFRTTRGFVCPYCTGRRLSADNCLAALFPAVVKEWHPTRNGNLKATDVTAYASRLVWWLCGQCGHEWQAVVADRTANRRSCSLCARRRHKLDLGQYPYALPYFDKVKNKGLDPHWLITRGKVYWSCGQGKDHVWYRSFNKKTAPKDFCPFCKRIRRQLTHSLASCYPDLARQWHPTRNGQLTAAQVMAQSNRLVWWLCQKCNHTWQARVANRSINRSGCPQCAKAKRGR
jgi:glutaredoxin